MISANWKYGIVIVVVASVWAGYLQLQHFKDKAQTLEQTNVVLESKLKAEMRNAQAMLDNANAQIMQLVVERNELTMQLVERERKQHEQREQLESDIKTIKKKMASVKCADVRFPDDVIKQLRQDY